MKQKNYYALLLIVLCSSIFIACDDDKDENEYPKTIEVEKLLVNEKEVSWSYFYAPVLDSVYIINSDEELFTFCDPRGNYPDITTHSNVDYTKNSVLLVGGVSTQGITTVANQYIQMGKQSFKIQVSVMQNLTLPVLHWAQVLVVPKVNTTDQISCETKYKLL